VGFYAKLGCGLDAVSVTPLRLCAALRLCASARKVTLADNFIHNGEDKRILQSYNLPRLLKRALRHPSDKNAEFITHCCYNIEDTNDIERMINF